MRSRLCTQGNLLAIITVAVLVSLGLVGLGSLGGCGVLSRPPDLIGQIAAARTPADHAAIAQAFRDRAQRFRAEAAEHSALADWWSGRASISPLAARRPGWDAEAQHCRRLAEHLAGAAKEAEAMAKIHEELARLSSEPQ